MTAIAIIGAGMAGLTLAEQLNERASVTVFEKSAGYGGRMATRTRKGFQFDHGAQFFTARTPHFKKFLQPYIEQGTVARWDARFAELDRNKVTNSRCWDDEFPHYVAVPGMNALCKAMAEKLNVKLETEIDGLQQSGERWLLVDRDGNELGEFDWVVLAMPAVQVDALLPDNCSFKPGLSEVPMLGCYSLMLGFEEELPLEWDAALIKDADISWACNNHTKPGRTNNPTLLVHATNRWADANMELDDADVIEHLTAETAAVTEMSLSHAVHVDLHRWRYANIGKQDGERYRVDQSLHLSAIGDWCIKGRIESAHLSGLALANAFNEQLL